MVNVALLPQSTDTLPGGVIVPPAPAEAAIVYEIRLNEAAIVWSAVTFDSVWLAPVPTDTPSTSTSAMVWQASGVMVKVASSPQFTDTLPLGLIEPPAPA